MLLGQLLTTKEAADLVKVSPNTVSMWLWKGKLPRIKAGGRTLISRDDLEQFLQCASGRETK
jgi:excisionase family DNA binding protein